MDANDCTEKARYWLHCPFYPWFSIMISHHPCTSNDFPSSRAYPVLPILSIMDTRALDRFHRDRHTKGLVRGDGEHRARFPLLPAAPGVPLASLTFRRPLTVSIRTAVSDTRYHHRLSLDLSQLQDSPNVHQGASPVSGCFSSVSLTISVRIDTPSYISAISSRLTVVSPYFGDPIRACLRWSALLLMSHK